MVRRLGVLSCIALMLFSCALESTVQFRVGSLQIPLHTRMLVLEPGVAGYELSIGETVAPRAADAALFVRVSGRFDALDIAVGFEDDRTDLASARPVPGSDTFSFYVPLGGVDRFDSVYLAAKGTDTGFSVREAGLADRTRSVELGREARIDTDISVDVEIGNPHTTYRIDFGRLLQTTRSSGSEAGVGLRYRYTSTNTQVLEHDTEVWLSVYGPDGEHTLYRVRPALGDRELSLHPSVLGFLPETVVVDSHEPGFRLLGAWVSGDKKASGPIPADLNTIIEYPSSAWREEAYEVFRWNRFPSILVFDTRDYEVQAALFRRLSFFVEKLGFAGRVLTDEELEGRHGWNAHDYRAVDLAGFFNEAPEEVLTSKERELREILLGEGVIRRHNGEYVGGAGGIISVSQISFPRLRELFVRHEGYHGVFFADEAYRRAVFDVWASLNEPEREFWRQFLKDRSYNDRDEYLVVNEFQAYLLQQPLAEVDAYFVGYAVPQFRRTSPAYADLVDELLAENPESFSSAARRIVETARIEADLDLTSLFCLEPTDAASR